MPAKRKARPSEDSPDIPSVLLREKGEPKAPPIQEGPRDDTVVEVEGLHFQRVFYTGMALVRPGSPLHYEVKESDCPNFGQSSAFVLRPNQEGKRKKSTRVILFCPYTLKANQVTPDAGELVHHVESRVETTKTKIEGGERSNAKTVFTPIPFAEEQLTRNRVDRLVRIMTRNWTMRCEHGLAIDIEVATSVLQRLGAEIPAIRPTVRKDASTGEAKVHGKDAGAALIKPLSAKSKRAGVFTYFAQGGKSVLEAMAEFGSTRSGVLTHLHGLYNDHGIGYTLISDIVEMRLPPGCEDPFKEAEHATRPEGTVRLTVAADADDDPLGGLGDGPQPKGAKAKAARTTEQPAGKSEGSTRGKGKPCAKEVTALPEKGKRREVALYTCKGWQELKDVASHIGASEGSVRSHLVDLHTKHGFGYEQDGGRVRLVAPKGWKP